MMIKFKENAAWTTQIQNHSTGAQLIEATENFAKRCKFNGSL
jgi:hypothetical protein